MGIDWSNAYKAVQRDLKKQLDKKSSGDNMDKFEKLRNIIMKFYEDGCQKNNYYTVGYIACESCKFKTDCRRMLRSYTPRGVINVFNSYENYTSNIRENED